ncbi:MAG: hypothetical protein SAK29_27170, partial [Scytonema sp. PMC 1069.18]|nr:hypothetical protein [Scytonema sp. PMC 1069.18]
DKNYLGSQIYPDIVNEYELEIWCFICRKIKEFQNKNISTKTNSSVSYFMIWLNSCANFIFKKASARFKPIPYEVVSLDQYLYTVPDTKEVPLSEKLRNVIEKDNKDIFSKECIRNKPCANFREITLLSLNGDSMTKIAEKFGVPLQTLYTFYKRCVNKYRQVIIENI